MNPRIKELRSILHHHNALYHTQGKSEITDAQFDTLLAELQTLEVRHPKDADPNSPTARVGGEPFPGFAEHKHEVKMLSLEKVFTLDDLAAWHQLHAVAFEPKIDGLSLALQYASGQLLRAVTRGDGTAGAVCTANARAITSIPLVLPVDFTGEVRGEVYMSKASFAANNRRLVDQGEEEFANPRNAAAGTFKSLDPKVVAERKLSFVAYEVIPVHYNYRENQKWLEAQGFVTTGRLLSQAKITDARLFEAPDFKDAVATLLPRWQTALERLEVETDGVVIKYTEPKVRQELGAGTRALKWAVAYKFPPRRAKTKLLDIVLSVGRTGIVCPNAVLEPVWIDGTWVSAASLCNQDEIDRLGVRPGDNVWVQKSGEIVPKVVGLAP
jgi:DNA ligase (NAD+)